MSEQQLSEDAGAFGISPKELADINQNKDIAALNSKGSATGIAKLLHSDLESGLKSDDVASHRNQFGANVFKSVPAKTFLSIFIETLKDPTLLLLMFAATVSTGLGAGIPEERKHGGWIEGVAIWGAVLLVSLVGSFNDYQKELQFRKLNAEKDCIMIKVVRDGAECLVSNEDVVVGDLMLLDTGDKVIADGLYVEGFGLVLDEASLTGESDPIKKNAEKDPWCRSGTQVTEGSGKILIVGVGPVSEWGLIMDKVTGDEQEETPLQEKLGFVASAIGKVGFIVATAAFIILIIRWCVAKKGFPFDQINNNGPVQFFLYAVTIVVVAVPEGLPLAVTISLAYSMKKMMKDNNFVRHLAACETMGGATAICSDKTGTLTENRMTVVEGWFQGKQYRKVPNPDELNANIKTQLINNICLNSKAFYIEEPGKKVEFVGNRTDCALLLMCQREWKTPYDAIRKEFAHDIVKLYGFSSAKKMASVLVDQKNGNLRLYNKGASEWVLEASVAVCTEDGRVEPLTTQKKKELMDIVVGMATRGLRTLVLTYTDFPKDDPNRPADFFDEPPDKNLTVMAIVGIKDPVRQEVPGAVATCKRAGICVRMVTGDNIHTAKHIAEECGILYGSEGIAMEGPEFRAMSEEDMKAMLPRLQVLARSSPTDKYILVKTLRSMGEVVAVTGDGTNDAPALKESDVGLAMGIAGTEVAKEAADIVILDDNFKSIVLAVLWGRSVFNNIRKFLQFQLTINIVALVIAFIGSFVSKEPLNVLQLLWVNMIMDTLAALALATEAPHVSLLSHKPHGREAPLINGSMWKHMIVQSVYQVIVMVLILFLGPELIDSYRIRSKCEVFKDASESSLTVGDDYFCMSSDVIDREMGAVTCERLYSFGPGNLCPTFDSPDKVDWCGIDESCDAYNVAEKVKSDFEKYYDRAVEHDERASKSLLFNAFIFMQLFNEINSRKIQDEYNIFQGIHHSPIFFGVLAITTVLQVIIVQTPVSSIFKVEPLNGVEWAVSLAFGIFSMPLSFIVRVISREIFGVNRPQKGQDVAEMDLGYGAKVVETVLPPKVGVEPAPSSPKIPVKQPGASE